MHVRTRTGGRLKAAELPAGYDYEVDTVEEAAWYDILGRFDDANIYQTWAYDEVRCGRNNISHLLLKQGGEIVAAAQSRIVHVPLLGSGIAYVRWGPLWRRESSATSLETFRYAIRALRNEYACRRGFVLRIYPVLFEGVSSPFVSILSEEGYCMLPQQKPDRTLILDVSRPLQELRGNCKPHWQRDLKTAEKKGLTVVGGDNQEIFGEFVRIYREMVQRKKFAEPNDIRDFSKIQQRLPAHLKMRVVLCKADGTVSSGAVCSAMGAHAVYLFGATANAGLKIRGAAHLLQWNLIEEIHKRGIRSYDLNGIDPINNSGTYGFKAGLAGSNGRDLTFLGKFQAHGNTLSDWGVACGEYASRMYRGIRGSFVTRGDRPMKSEAELQDRGPARTAGMPSTGGH